MFKEVRIVDKGDYAEIVFRNNDREQSVPVKWGLAQMLLFELSLLLEQAEEGNY